MKAVVYSQYGSPDILQIQEVAKPVPKENEVLIKVVVASVSSTDSALRKGDQWIVRLVFGLTRPKKTILGTEFSGFIEQTGKQVTRFKTGSRSKLPVVLNLLSMLNISAYPRAVHSQSNLTKLIIRRLLSSVKVA